MHAFSVFGNPSKGKKSQKTSANKHIRHNPNLKDAIITSETKGEQRSRQATCLTIEAYLKTLKSTKEQLKTIKRRKDGARILQNTYTATGHDLSKRDELNSFSNGLSREIFKAEVMVQRIQGSNSFSSPGEDYYCQEIVVRAQNANNVEEFGRILMEPAPCGEVSKSKKSKKLKKKILDI
jgi:hypothetical protein